MTDQFKPNHSLSIVTPSFNMLADLKLCCASVKDQGLPIEHVVMDGGSSDGTLEWLSCSKDILFISEKDKGMYNALNKAIDMSTSEIIGHLNCDEQYLPGILEFVKTYFDQNPEIDFIAGNFLVTDNNGDLLAYRKSFHPRWPYFFSNYLYTTTCTLFYRKKIFDTCRFDESFRSISDVIFLYNVLKKGFKGIHIPRYFSVFKYSGTNLSLDPISAIEKERFNKTLPIWYRIFKPVFFIGFFIERIFNGTYWEKANLSYAIFTKESLTKRVVKNKANPTFRLKFSPVTIIQDEHQ